MPEHIPNIIQETSPGDTEQAPVLDMQIACRNAINGIKRTLIIVSEPTITHA